MMLYHNLRFKPLISVAHQINMLGYQIQAEGLSDATRVIFSAQNAAAAAAQILGFHIPMSQPSDLVSSLGAYMQLSLCKAPQVSQERSIKDFILLSKVSSDQRWTDSTLVPADFFAQHSEFDVNSKVEGKAILEISSNIDARLIEYFRQNPERMYNLSPRQFEELIAELFDGFGFKVELTKRTRDGGHDIVAVSNEPYRIRCLVECKRYADEHKVGVGIVRSLHGTIVTDGANKGIVATTSYFSKDASAYINTNKWILEGRDFHGICDWLRQYQIFSNEKRFVSLN